MNDMGGEEIDESTIEILKQCSVYPKPHPDIVYEEYNKTKSIMHNSSGPTPSDERLKKKVATALDLRQRIKTNGSWIKYSKK